MTAQEYTPYNPLGRRNLAVSVANSLLQKEPVPLGKVSSFIGAGIYALYYRGEFELYQRISQYNKDNELRMPIYVGKAVPKGSRRGGGDLGVNPGTVLYDRLCEHAASITQVRGLEIEDFFCRYLAVEDIYIPLGESLLIHIYKPMWNKYLSGFGNHDPGAGRRKQQRSLWDVIHPGRPWASVLADNKKSIDVIVDGANKFLDKTKFTPITIITN